MKIVLLSRGLLAVVDDEDWPLISQYSWSAVEGKHTYYAEAALWEGGKATKFKMHRMILRAPAAVGVDHIDGCGLNNTRNNLRLADGSSNNLNSRKRTRHLGRLVTSQFKGVSKANYGWEARFRYKDINYRKKFRTEEEAARAYDAQVKLHSLGFGRLNFPEVDDDAGD